MSVELPLDQMTLPEKLQLMEALWDDLTRKPDELPSPAWHEEVLADCRRRVESGEEQFSDWEDAKEDVRRQISRRDEECRARRRFALEVLPHEFTIYPWH